MRNILLVAVSATALAACGGGGGGDGNPDRPTSALGTEGLSVDDVTNVASFVLDATDGFDFTPANQVPTSASANYYGAVVVEANSPTDPVSTDPFVSAIGVMTVNVDFDSRTASGNAGSFYNTNSLRSAPGTLTLENATLAPIASGSDIFGDLNGEIQFDQADVVFDLDGTLFFGGDTGQGLAGEFSGSAVTPGGMELANPDAVVLIVRD